MKKTQKKDGTIISTFLQVIYYGIYPLLFVFGARANGQSVYQKITMLLTGIKGEGVPDEDKITWQTLPNHTRVRIVLFSMGVIALQAFLIYVFVNFSLIEALFWKSLIEKEAQTFYYSAVGMILFKLAEVLGGVLKKYFQSNIIVQWREDYTKQLNDRLVKRLKEPVLEKSGKVYGAEEYKEWATTWSQMIEQNVNEMFKAAITIVFNSIDALMLTWYFGYTLASMSGQMIVCALAIALGLKLLVDLVNYVANNHVYKKYQDSQVQLRAKTREWVCSAACTYSLGVGEFFKKEVDKANENFSKSARSYALFRTIIDAIRWGLRQIIEPLSHILTAVFYFTGHMSFVRLNLMTNAAIKLIHTLLDLGTDVDRYNTFDMVFKSVEEGVTCMPIKKKLTRVELESTDFINSFTGESLTFDLAPNPKTGQIMAIKAENGVGKTCFYRHLSGAHCLSSDSAKQLDLEIIGGFSIDKLIRGRDLCMKCINVNDKVGSGQSISDGQRAWRHLISYYYFVKSGKLAKPEILILDELDAAIDEASKTAFHQACKEIVSTLQVKGFVTSHSNHQWDSETTLTRSGGGA
ncbi:hypothetical protein N9C31_03275 [Gammaproteobacteria bacterium]|nr:hypothetical protein [Gammaproteobacteria bacterium]